MSRSDTGMRRRAARNVVADPHTRQIARSWSQHISCITRPATMGEPEITHRMQRPALLGLIHQLLEHDFVTAKIQAPPTVRDVAESDRVTAIIAVPRVARPSRRRALVFTVAFLVGFALTFWIVA